MELSIQASSEPILDFKNMMKTRKIGLFALSLLAAGHLTFSQQYKLDPGHTLIEFNVERFMVGEVTGKFKKYEGTVTLDDNDELQSAGIIVQTGSLDRITKLGMDT